MMCFRRAWAQGSATDRELARPGASDAGTAHPGTTPCAASQVYNTVACPRLAAGRLFNYEQAQDKYTSQLLFNRKHSNELYILQHIEDTSVGLLLKFWARRFIAVIFVRCPLRNVDV